MAIEDCEKRGGDGVIRLLVECQCGKRFYFRSTSFYSGAPAIRSCMSWKIEISSHDLFEHIGVQLLQFSVSFAQAGRKIEEVLFDEVCAPRADPKHVAESTEKKGGFRNLEPALGFTRSRQGDSRSR